MNLPRRLRSALALIALAACPSLAIAQSLPGDGPASAEACAALGMDSERLACYDRFFGHEAPVGVAEVAGSPEPRERQQDLPPVERTGRFLAELFDYDRDHGDPERYANAGRGGLLDTRWELAKGSKLGTFNFRAYKPVYLLPAVWFSSVNQLPSSSDPNMAPLYQPLRSVEAKYQISFKTKALENIFGHNGDLWMAYTQSSRWQVYNSKHSRPFRESNYEPEFMLVFRNNYHLGDWRGRMVALSLNHQSNGRADPLSRSWNRVILNVGLDRENWALTLRPWWLIPENNDDNPGIQNYIGRGDATLIYHRDGHEFALMARHSLRGGSRSRGALQFDWGFPLTRTLRGHLQIFDGYGESLIDYNHRSFTLGLGVSLLEWF